MRDFGTRATEGSQGWGQPRAELANRYQSTVTGDFCEKLIPKNPADTDARTAVNSALNPESYKDRDYRMKSTLLWDGETMVTMLNLSFDRGTNILYGDNAQGKTNILEAIYLCATTKSHKGAKDKDIVNFNEEEAHIRAYLEKKEDEIRIDMHLRKTNPRHCD